MNKAETKMGLFSAEDSSFLIELGLTVSESRVYWTLVQIGASPTGSISKATGIHRQNVYHTLNSLENKGLVQKQIETPPKYKATPVNEALDLLINRKQTQISRLKTRAQAVMQNLKQYSSQDPTSKETQENADFKMTAGAETIVRRLKEAIQQAQTSLEIITTPTGFSSAILEFGQDYTEALQRDVTIRVATQNPALKAAAFEIVQTLMIYSNFEVRYFPGPSQATVTIIDGKQAMITLSTTARFNGASSLWSSNECFVALIQNYFKTAWSNALKVQVPRLRTFSNW